jgi:t-SNARE complex subunit (syntaxin)
MDASERQIHDAVPDEEDGDVPRDVVLVVQHRGEPIVADVVEEVQAEERRDAGGVEREVPRVVGHLQRAHQVVHEDAPEHVQPEDREVLGAEPDVLGDERGELVHHGGHRAMKSARDGFGDLSFV